MRPSMFWIALIGHLLLATSPAGAQDYRGRVQGTVLDASQGALPGATVTLTNDATGVAVTFVTDTDGRYIFDFVDPGTYTITAELAGIQDGASSGTCACRSAATSPSDLTLDVGGARGDASPSKRRR